MNILLFLPMSAYAYAYTLVKTTLKGNVKFARFLLFAISEKAKTWLLKNMTVFQRLLASAFTFGR